MRVISLQETNQPRLLITSVPPYTEVLLGLRACTRWGCSRPTEHTFRSPMAAPTRPVKLAVFVRHDHSLQADTLPVTSHLFIHIVLRWFPPTQPNGNIDSYEVYTAPSTGGPWSKVSVAGTVREYKINNVPPRRFYYFKVGACTPVSCGQVAGPVHANTSVENPEPNLLAMFDDRLNLVYPYFHGRKVVETAKVTSLTYVMPNSHSLFWIDEDNQLVQVNGLGKTKLLTLNGTGNSLSADWVGRALYWLEETSDKKNAIMKYDLYRNNGRPERVTSLVATPGMMVVAPLTSSLYWTSFEVDGSVTLLTAGLNGSHPQSVFDPPNLTKPSRRRHRRESCSCPPHLTITEVFTLDHSRKGVLELYVVDKLTGSVVAMDTDGCHCKRVVDTQSLHNTSLPPDSLVVDHQRVYWLNKTDHVVKSVDKFTGQNLVLETSGNISTLVAYSYMLQPEPEPACLILSTYPKRATLIKNSKSSISLRLLPWQPRPECRSISAPVVKYTLHYKMVVDGETTCLTQDTFDLDVTLSSLQPYSHYLVHVSVSNFYTDNWRTTHNALGPGVVFQTLPGVPSPVRNVTVRANTPTEVMVNWKSPERPNGPLTDIIYFIEWLTVNTDGSRSHDRVGVVVEWSEGASGDDQYNAHVKNLRASQLYHLKVLAYDKRMTGHSSSPTMSTLTYQYPGPIQLLDMSKTSVTVGWTSPSDDSVARHTIECTKVTEEPNWSPQNWIPEHTENDTTYNETFHDLQANTEYAFRVKVIYKSMQHFVWPLAMKFKFRTAADVPGQPVSPVVLRHDTRGVKEVSWKEPDNGGATILMYKLICRRVNGDNWTTVYNGSDTRWVIGGLEHGEVYVFRVAALNAIGWSTFSANSTTMASVAVTEVARSQDQLTIVLASIFAIILLLIIVAAVTFTIACRRYKQQKPVPFNLAHVLRQNPDLELATLRELPRVTLQQSNALYAINIVPTDEDIAALPHFHRDQLTLTKFLGSGAFGEVFEGIARNIITSTSGETKVAVKTLRKGATDQEKEEFLKEAVLMSNFIEEHILRLLGVCLDNDPQFIILELMEGGDLLSYLRASRPTPMFDAKLALPDMVNICVDVAQGCKYLEDMHFVHRDLAARNCLVSLRNGQRQVKIGDFGLARDIYKSDYYRKEGEGLLPVRWMSPESLVDGVFTTQSDVWAFAVMMWEVLTLGQQPYPARSNIEVLNFVRSGGRLDRPDNCPDDVYYLMLKCWQFVPEDRPSFKYILDQLQVFKDRCRLHDSDFTTQPASATGTVSRGPTMGTMERIKSFIVGGMDTDGVEKTNQPKMRLQDAVRRAITFDRKNAHGTRPHGEDAHGYLEPLVPPLDEQHKYLELLDTLVVHTAPPGESIVLANGCARLPTDVERRNRDDSLVVLKQNRESESPGSEGKSRKCRSPRLETGKHVSYTPLATSDIDSTAESDAEMSGDLCDDQKCDSSRGQKESSATNNIVVGADSSQMGGQVLPPTESDVPQTNAIGQGHSKCLTSVLDPGEDRTGAGGGSSVSEGDTWRS
ncbi:hypothetical protein NP493_187g02000 [Ridgeia piscesae]|uniref:Tyrosine-protein kinase receptor n=1 Tax=Ridgeia piscesae TaxID=27915 RepID=A0AAD9P279_RIDPI|nr:hypothetical protein NP493_187g02000 [Ridgeia piscesae]